MKIFKSAYFRHFENRPVFGSLSFSWVYTLSALSLA